MKTTATVAGVTIAAAVAAYAVAGGGDTQPARDDAHALETSPPPTPRPTTPETTQTAPTAPPTTSPAPETTTTAPKSATMPPTTSSWPLETLPTTSTAAATPAPAPPPTAPASSQFRPDVERWRPLVTTYFGGYGRGWVKWALGVIECESRGDPDAKNPNSTASGLFQHLARYWGPTWRGETIRGGNRAARAGWPGADIFDPEANIAVAAWLLDVAGPGSWRCNVPHPHPHP